MGKDEEKEIAPSPFGGTSWLNHLGERVWRYIPKLESGLPHDPTSPLLKSYSKGIIRQVDKHTMHYSVKKLEAT